MKSMTGFGRGNVTSEAFSVAVEIKTVNNRFLDVHLRLTQELAPLEMNIRKLITTRLSRGRVDLSINLEGTGGASYEINRKLIAGYIKALRDVQTEFNLTGDVDINTLTRLPGALGQTRSGIDESATGEILKAIAERLAAAETMRAGEGETLPEQRRVRLAKIQTGLPVSEDAAAG